MSESIERPASRLTAFEHREFLQSRQARTLRVLAELLEPQYRLAKEGIDDTIVFFGSSRMPGPTTRPGTPASPRCNPTMRRRARSPAG